MPVPFDAHLNRFSEIRDWRRGSENSNQRARRCAGRDVGMCVEVPHSSAGSPHGFQSRRDALRNIRKERPLSQSLVREQTS